MIATLFLALGLVLILEGLAYALAPSFIERMFKALVDTPEQARRLLGILSIVLGIVLLWIANALGLTLPI